MNGQFFMEEFMQDVKPLVTQIQKATPIKRPSTQNGMAFQGFVMFEGSPIDFYGSESAWQKFKDSYGVSDGNV